MVKRGLRDEARRLRREEGVSVRKIAIRLGVSKSSVSLWVRDIVLTQAQIEGLKANQHRYGAQNKGARTNSEKFRKQRLAYQQAGRERARTGSRLHLMGCMLYWAEGAKKKNAVYFVNSDPNMMLLFLRFLREEMFIANEAMAVHIHCHTHDPEEIRRIEAYWLDLLRLPKSCLRKTQIKKGSDTRRNIHVNGVCGVAVNNTELTHHIYGAIQEYGGFENPAWLY
jgi:transcriptional regulator with XRE-family HTH domain